MSCTAAAAAFKSGVAVPTLGGACVLCHLTAGGAAAAPAWQVARAGALPPENLSIITLSTTHTTYP